MKNKKIRQLILLVLVSILLVVLIWEIADYIPRGVDWHNAFRPAAWRMLKGEELYGAEGHLFVNPPWALFPLLPLALLPETVGRSVLFFISIAAFMFVANRLGGKLPAIILLILSPPVVQGLFNANIDGLAILGFILPPQIGLFFISAKPQIGIAVGLYWLYDIWRYQGFREVLRVFSPFFIFASLSFAVWGFWPLNFTNYSDVYIDLAWNLSFWPLSLPIGLLLLAIAIQRRKFKYAMAASPCFSPYVSYHSWVVTILAGIHSIPAMIAVFLGLWILELAPII